MKAKGLNMRIAVSGTHFTGKSTLIEDAIEHLPQYESVAEPYYLLEEAGYEFPAIPSLEDFEQQLSKSIQLISMNKANIIFDRSPLDFVAYALCSEDSDSFDLEEWMPKIQDAIKTLDFIVYLPLENRIPVPKSLDDDLRYDVDEKLVEILMDNSLDLDIEVIEIKGSRDQRTKQLIQLLATPKGSQT
jgi:hypothetical protein